MKNTFLLVLLILLFLGLYLPITANAHTSKPLPFTLLIQKNISLWLHQGYTTLALNPAGNFTYFEGWGYCCGGCGSRGNFGRFAIKLYLNNQLVNEVVGYGSRAGNGAPYRFDFNNISDKAEWVGFGDCSGAYIGYMGGRFEVLQQITPVTFDSTDPNKEVVRINTEPVSLGTLNTDLSPGITLRKASNTPEILKDEEVLITSSNPNVKVWFGNQDPTKGTTTTKETANEVWACSDADRSGTCDYIDAADNNCDITGGENAENDWYRTDPATSGWCCKATNICEYRADFNAFCGKMLVQGEVRPRFATSFEVGEIHDFTECTQKVQVVFDASKKLQACNSTLPSGFLTINNHEYACNATKPEIFECGGNVPISFANALRTGQSTQLFGRTNYCLENNIFSPNIDYATQKVCEDANFDWTGTRCCSEADDLLGGNNNEYYGENYAQNPPNPPDLASRGGCWNSTFIENSKNAPKFANNSQTDKSIINYNGTFYGCMLTDATLLALKDTDPHKVVGR